jgi:hypothetical protein
VPQCDTCNMMQIYGKKNLITNIKNRFSYQDSLSEFEMQNVSKLQYRKMPIGSAVSWLLLRAETNIQIFANE